MIGRLEIVFILILCACQFTKKEGEKIDLLFKSINLPVDQSKSRAVLIIPIDGCPGCVTSALEFVSSNTDKESLLSE